MVRRLIIAAFAAFLKLAASLVPWMFVTGYIFSINIQPKQL
jgi:hypothetical protein